MSSPAETRLLHSSFYRFVPLPDPAEFAQALRAAGRALAGTITVAAEGVSGAVAGTPDALAGFEAALLDLLRPLCGANAIHFKHSACDTPPFGRLKVSVKPELVGLGLDGIDAYGRPDQDDASHLTPAAWRDLLASGEAVVLDNRNHFEFRLGRFQGAVDPAVHHFRDFVAYVEAHAPTWRAESRPVAMYCTGGIRCDKTAPWLRSLGLQVFQLDGGILNYFQQTPDAERDWDGECFVFDNRIALDTQLRETATQAAQVFDAQHADEAWRLARALRLEAAAQRGGADTAGAERAKGAKGAKGVAVADGAGDASVVAGIAELAGAGAGAGGSGAASERPSAMPPARRVTAP